MGAAIEIDAQVVPAGWLPLQELATSSMANGASRNLLDSRASSLPSLAPASKREWIIQPVTSRVARPGAGQCSGHPSPIPAGHHPDRYR